MIICDIYNNILIYHLYYSGKYQEESENLELHHQINNIGVGIKTKNAENALHVTH